MMRSLFFVLVLIYISGRCDEQPPEGSLTTVLNQDNFDDLVTNS